MTTTNSNATALETLTAIVEGVLIQLRQDNKSELTAHSVLEAGFISKVLRDTLNDNWKVTTDETKVTVVPYTQGDAVKEMTDYIVQEVANHTGPAFMVVVRDIPYQLWSLVHSRVQERIGFEWDIEYRKQDGVLIGRYLSVTENAEALKNMLGNRDSLIFEAQVSRSRANKIASKFNLKYPGYQCTVTETTDNKFTFLVHPIRIANTVDQAMELIPSRNEPIAFPNGPLALDGWYNRPYEAFKNDIADALRRRPWSTYFVVPSKYADLVAEDLAAGGWSFKSVRVSRCGTRTHFKVNGYVPS